jgi:hypothetical protein
VCSLSPFVLENTCRLGEIWIGSVTYVGVLRSKQRSRTERQARGSCQSMAPRIIAEIATALSPTLRPAGLERELEAEGLLGADWALDVGFKGEVVDIGWPEEAL